MSIENGGPWPPINPPQQVRPSLHYKEPQPTLSGPALPDHNNPNTVYRYTLHTTTNPNQEAIKTALMAVCLAFMIVLFVDLLAANYIVARILWVAHELSQQLGQ